MQPNLEFWSVSVIICAFVLLIEVAGLIRGLLLTRGMRWSACLLVLPLAVSIWSFAVALSAIASVPYYYYDLHLTMAIRLAFRAAMDQAIRACQLQVALIIGVFILTLFAERRFHLRYAFFERTFRR